MHPKTFIYRALLACALIFGLAACASTPPPHTSEELGMARAAIEAAEQQRASEFAPDLLAQARNRLAQAEAARQREDYVAASRLAEQARLDAKLAALQADLVTTDVMVRELETTVVVLEDETGRR